VPSSADEFVGWGGGWGLGVGWWFCGMELSWCGWVVFLFVLCLLASDSGVGSDGLGCADSAPLARMIVFLSSARQEGKFHARGNSGGGGAGWNRLFPQTDRTPEYCRYEDGTAGDFHFFFSQPIRRDACLRNGSRTRSGIGQEFCCTKSPVVMARSRLQSQENLCVRLLTQVECE